MTLAANASDPDGRVAKVEFFANGQKVGEDDTSPYSLSWTAAQAGSYSLSARATDNAGMVTMSATVSLTLTPPPPPSPPPGPPDIAVKPVPPNSACAAATLAFVIDGDTLQVTSGGISERVRIGQVDAPERSQAYGIEATACLSRLVSGAALTICRDGKDRYDRTIANVMANGANVAQGLVSSGCAWAYTKYLEAGSPLPALEMSARAARAGLWALQPSTEPWLYRSGSSPVTYDRATGTMAVAVRTSQRASVHDRVFDWAEHQYPDLLRNGSVNQLLGDGTIYRCYATGFCVGYRPGVFLTYDGATIREAGTEAAMLTIAEAQGF